MAINLKHIVNKVDVMCAMVFELRKYLNLFPNVIDAFVFINRIGFIVYIINIHELNGDFAWRVMIMVISALISISNLNERLDKKTLRVI